MTLSRYTWALVAVLASLLLADTAQAQIRGEVRERPRYAVFVSTLFTPEIWETSNTPDDWVQRGIIDGYIVLDEHTSTLTQELAGVTSSGSLLNYLTATGEIYADISNCLRTGNSPGNPCFQTTALGSLAQAELLIVGHHVGGWVARVLGYALDEHLLSSVPVFGATLGQYPHSVTVVTVATPNQGIRALPALAVQRGGAALNTFVTETQAPLNGSEFFGARPGQLQSLDSSINAINNLVGNLQGQAQFMDNINLLQPFAPGGPVINFINGLPDPENYLSLYSTEKPGIPVRFVPELAGTFNINGAEALADPNEEGTAANNLGGILFYYDFERFMWDNCENIQGIAFGTIGGIAGAILPGVGSVITGAAGALIGIASCWIRGSGPKADRWERALAQWNGLDNLYAQMIDSRGWTTVTRTVTVRQCERPGPGGGSGGDFRVAASMVQDPEIQAELQALARINVCEPGQPEFITRTIQQGIFTLVPNDGLTPPTDAVWDPYDDHTVNVTSGTANGNAYFGTAGDEGGYNFLELRRSRRAYGDMSTDDIGIDVGNLGRITLVDFPVPFEAGDVAPPLNATQRWWFRKINASL